MVEEILVIAVRRRGALDVAAAGAQKAAPCLDLPRPFLRHFGEHGKARASVFATLGVMSGGSQHSVRPALGALHIDPMERSQCHTELIGMATHFVQRDKTIVTIEGGVLEPLRHDGATVLLHPHREADHRLPAEPAARPGHQVGGQEPVQKIEDAGIEIRLVAPRLGYCPINVSPVRFRRLGSPVDISAVYRKAGDKFL